MSTERWNDERLDRLADLIESNARAAERHDLILESNARAAERHDRLLESNARAIEALANASTAARKDIDRHDRLIESNARVIKALADAIAEAGEERQQLFERMDQQYAMMLQHHEEIRGLQTENRRILDILLNQQNREDDSTDE